MEIVIKEEYDGILLRDLLKNKLRLSTKAIAKLKNTEHGITIDGRHVTVRHILRSEETLFLATEDRAENPSLVPREMPLDIIFEDEDILMLNKPPRLPTHPSHGHYEDTLANGVCFYMKEKYGVPFIFRSANRLDRDTSGLVLIAKNRLAASRLQKSMQAGLIKKKYIALLGGRLQDTVGRIETYIRRREKSIIFREVCEPLPDAALAITEFSVLSTSVSSPASAVIACPITGRTHQLRVHFAHIGAPIIGDGLYGEPSELIERQALHAFYLSFPHPKNDEIIEFTAPLPSDMLECARISGLEIEVNL